MQNIPPSVAKTIAYYYPLLLRYGTMVTGNRDEAESIARKVLEEQYEINGLVPSRLLRVVLKTDVLNRCFYFKQGQLFKRPPLKVPFDDPFNPENYNDNPLVN